MRIYEVVIFNKRTNNGIILIHLYKKINHKLGLVCIYFLVLCLFT